MSARARWASSRGRTAATVLASGAVATVVGTATWALGMLLVVNAVAVSGGMTNEAAGNAVIRGLSPVLLGVSAVAVVVAAWLPTIVLVRRARAGAPRLVLTLVVGLAAAAAFWARAIAVARDAGAWLDVFVWPTHLAAWWWITLAQVVTANLTTRRPVDND